MRFLRMPKKKKRKDKTMPLFDCLPLHDVGVFLFVCCFFLWDGRGVVHIVLNRIVFNVGRCKTAY